MSVYHTYVKFMQLPGNINSINMRHAVAPRAAGQLALLDGAPRLRHRQVAAPALAARVDHHSCVCTVEGLRNICIVSAVLVEIIIGE